MADYIERERVVETIYFLINNFANHPAKDTGLKSALRIVQNAPTEDVAPVVHGRWEQHPIYKGFVRCSKCRNCIVSDDWIDDIKWSYCPECGAKMDLKGGD